MLTFVDQHFPIVIACWREPVTEEEIEGFFKDSRRTGERALRENQKNVYVLFMQTTLDAKRRTLLGEETKRFPKDMRALTISNVLVLESPLVHGAFTALSWVVPNLPVAPARNAADAVGKASALLAKVGALPSALSLEEVIATAAQFER